MWGGGGWGGAGGVKENHDFGVKLRGVNSVSGE